MTEPSLSIFILTVVLVVLMVQCKILFVMGLVLVGFGWIWNRALLAVKPALKSLNFDIVYGGNGGDSLRFGQELPC